MKPPPPTPLLPLLLLFHLPPPITSHVPNLLTHFPVSRLLQPSPNNLPVSAPTCDISFMNCIPDQLCVNCYVALINHDVAWADVTPDTPCSDVLDVLVDKHFCDDLRGNGRAQDAFCKVFDNCVVWEETQLDDDEEDAAVWLDCNQLQKCEWEGFHGGYIGDGICNRDDCYNSAVCGWDGGDCCKDTCDDTKNEYADCGSEHYFCMDPKSEYCDPQLNSACPQSNATKHKDEVKCSEGEMKFELTQYDSFGDGWGKTKMTIRQKVGDTLEDIKYEGGLKAGKEGVEYLCLAPGCYHVDASGGAWGDEATWEIKADKNKGGPPLASGGSPADCTFPIGGGCDLTCHYTGTGNDDEMYDDDEFEDYNSLEDCMEEKCMIQKDICEKDDNCRPCMANTIPVYCFTNEKYNALSRCSMCHCVEGKELDCMDDFDDDDVPPQGNNVQTPACNPEQTLSGSKAIFEYSQCSDIESTKAMIEDWHEDAFGGLDTFEQCAHVYNNEYAHGGKDPMDCMRILVSILADSNEKAAVKDIADKLYHSGEEFCDCASESNKQCPNCQQFMHFKTLLHESLDACVALDEIDCAAWSQFAEPCKSKMLDKFNSINFDNREQCDFITDGCGGVGPFPAFRRLDCGKEISKSAWDFYASYNKGCLGGDVNPVPPPPIPAPTGPAPIPSTDNKPPSKPYVPEDGPPIPAPTPYVPSPYIPKEQEMKAKKSHHFFWVFFTFCCAGGGYLYYKRQNSYEMPYRRYRNMMGDDDSLYGGLFDSTSASFEPPTLPPMT